MVAGLGGLMGQLGFSEMIVIFIVALLVFGPKKLPELGKSLGKGIREFRKATNELKYTWEEQVKDIENPLNDVKRDINDTAQEMKSDFYKQFEAETPETPAPEKQEAHSEAKPKETDTPKEHV